MAHHDTPPKELEPGRAEWVALVMRLNSELLDVQAQITALQKVGIATRILEARERMIQSQLGVLWASLRD